MSNIRTSEDVVIFPFSSDSKPVCIPSIGISYCDKNYRMQRKYTDCYSVEYVVEGKGYIQHEQKTYRVEKGDVFIAHAYTPHYYYADKDEPFTKIWFIVIGEFADYLFNFYGIKNAVYQGAECADLFFELFHLAKSGAEPKEMRRLTAIQLHKLLSELSVKKNLSPPDWLKQIKKRLDASLKEELVLEALAKDYAVSKSQLIRAFKKYYGETPYAYFLKRKLKVAHSMLCYGNLSIKQIALELHFADEFYFSNLFKKTYGLSPQALKKSARFYPAPTENA